MSDVGRSRWDGLALALSGGELPEPYEPLPLGLPDPLYRSSPGDSIFKNLLMPLAMRRSRLASREWLRGLMVSQRGISPDIAIRALDLAILGMGEKLLDDLHGQFVIACIASGYCVVTVPNFFAADQH